MLKYKITKFEPFVGVGNKLWDTGWRVGILKIWKWKFLIWKRPDENKKRTK